MENYLNKSMNLFFNYVGKQCKNNPRKIQKRKTENKEHGIYENTNTDSSIKYESI